MICSPAISVNLALNFVVLGKNSGATSITTWSKALTFATASRMSSLGHIYPLRYLPEYSTATILRLSTA